MTRIYHNPDCGTSRNVLAVLELAGENPEVILYVDQGWQADDLRALLAAANLSPRQALRVTRSPAADLGLTDPSVTDDVIFAAMLAHPILVNRPIVVTEKGTALCRPSEAVLPLLKSIPKGPVYKEDGDILIPA